jgi:hypothetical protein
MAHRYGDPIRIEHVTTESGESIVRAFLWRGRRYPIVQILESWHLQDKYWDPAQHSDRLYYRVETPDHGVYEIYLDMVSGAWVLDKVQD